MAITAKEVMNLRQRTGLGMMECKSALGETNGDVEAAVALLRERLKGKMEERAGREAGEGTLAVAKTNGSVAIIQLVSETDFVARNQQFIDAAERIAQLALQCPAGEVAANDAINKIVDELRITTKENVSYKRGLKLSAPVVGSYLHHNRQLGAVIACEGDFSPELLTGLCQHVTAAVPPMMPEPLAVDATGLPAEALEKQKAEFVAEAAGSGKPQQIIEKMIAGKLKKWVDEHTLLGQLYIREMDAKKPVRDYLPKGSRILRFARLQLG